MFSGTILGSILAFSATLSFRHWPVIIKNFLLKHYVISDILASVLVYMALSAVSSSLTAVSAAVVAGLLIEIALLVGRRIARVS